jgi:hypothetical protein
MATVLVPFVPPGVPIVAASVACLIGLRSSNRAAPDDPAASDGAPS